MSALAILGLIGLFAACLFFTVAALGFVLGEAWYSESLSPFSWLLTAIAVVMWALLLYLQPFRLILK